MARTRPEPRSSSGFDAQLAEIKGAGRRDGDQETTWAELDVDSLDLVELVKALEDEYGITIDDEELKPIASVGDAVTLDRAPRRESAAQRVSGPTS